MKPDRATLALIHRKVDEVVTNGRPPGVDKEWIKATTAEERLYALELVRRRVFGYEKTQAPISRVLEVMRQD